MAKFPSIVKMQMKFAIFRSKICSTSVKAIYQTHES